MATAIFGGSPRHHQTNRGSSVNLHQQQQHPQHPQQQMGSSSGPPPPYLASPVSLHQYDYGSPTHLQQQQQQHHHPHQMGGYAHGSYQMMANANALMPNPLYASQRSFSRKSAVEMLAESKAYYVKSETVLDRHQQLYRSGNMGSAPYMGSAGTLCSAANAGVSASASSLSGDRVAPGNSGVPNRRCSSSNSDLLQTKLRKLLNSADGKEAHLIISQPMKYAGQERCLMQMGHTTTSSNTPNTPGTFSYNSPKIHEQLSIHPEMQSDVSVFFPSAFLSPQSLPPHPASVDDIYTYGLEDNLFMSDDRPISPPSEYAAQTREFTNRCEPSSPQRYSYRRSSYIHSQPTVPRKHSEPHSSYAHRASSGDPQGTASTYNVSHKSLPDLHTHISRHSPHSEVSRGNRSNKSGSSFNRDSGGSSGHYTHRSEPNCCRQAHHQQQQQQQKRDHAKGDFRRDSGSSTQHSDNSHYGVQQLRYDCPECRSKMAMDECLLNFTTPEVPEAFQDDYDAKAKQRSYHEMVQRSGKPLPSPLDSPSNDVELSPPLGTFTRQRCLRIKNRSRFSSPSDDRRPILRSKSDISDRYWNKAVPPRDCGGSAPSKAKETRPKSESMSQLEKFFDRLGLNDEKYHEFIEPNVGVGEENDSDMSSPLFFSDRSSVDSNRLPDSTETQPQLTAQYRPNEPPSIVERNARIIKWLCNCRKVQLK